MALVQRLLNVRFTLAQGSFAESGTNTVTLSGLRASAKIVKAGTASMATLQLRLWGLTLSVMNQLSTLGMKLSLVPKNTVVVQAGDVTAGLGVVFQGTITNCYADFQGAPDVALVVEAHTLGFEAVQSITPTSFRGTVDVATVLAGLAAQMDFAFENNGVSATLHNPYYSGSPRQQALLAVQDAGINWNGCEDGKLAIWPRGSARGGSVPLISPSTGMEGYPTYIAEGILVRTLFNPAIAFGAKIQVQSSLTPANGIWVVFSLDHDLESQIPNGQWATVICASNPMFPPPVLIH